MVVSLEGTAAMSNSNGGSPMPPPRASASLVAQVAQAFQAAATATQRWVSVWRELAKLADEMGRRIAPYVQALQDMARCPEMERLARGVVGWLSLLETAPQYCVPYNREIAQLGLEPLTEEEQRSFLTASVLLQGGRERRLGSRLPLAEVALMAGRHDIAAAVAMGRPQTRAGVQRLERGSGQEEGELLGDAYLALLEEILPSIQRRLHRIPMAEAPSRLRPLLEEVVRDAYLVKSIRRALVRRLKREAKRAEAETEFSSDLAERLAKAERRPDPELDWRIEEAIASFLERPRASELDRKLVAALRRWPDCSIAEIARRIAKPIRTVQDHRKKLDEHVREYLQKS